MADHKRKKKRGRSKIFTSCFRSFPADERPLIRHKSGHRIVRDGRLGKPVLAEVSGCKEEECAPDVNLVTDGVTGNGTGSGGERPARGGGFSRLLKAVLFESVMVKKIRSSSRSSIASVDTNESFSSIENTAKPLEDSTACGTESTSTDIEDSSSRRSNLLSSSSQTTSTSYSCSSSPSTNSNSRWLPEPKTSPLPDSVDLKPPIPSNPSTSNKPNQINSNSPYSFNLRRQNTSTSLPIPKPKPKRTNSLPQSSSHHKQLSQFPPLDSNKLFPFSSTCNNYNIRWCLLLLLSLIVLVVYGRIYSILCTSTWFYLVPCKRSKIKRVNSVTNKTRLDTDSDQYKKRVIMAGLLDRTRNPLR